MSDNESHHSEKVDAVVESPEEFSLKDISDVKALEQEEIIEYVDKLHKVLQTKEKKIAKHKEKIERLLQIIKDLKAPVKNQSQENEQNSLESSKSITGASVSLVDEIRQAAEQAQNLSGFVYEPTSGLYYDQKTGYYYNAEFGLYYDGNTGCYYNYNQDKNVFEFHSQVEVQPNQAAAGKADEKYVINDGDDKGEDGGGVVHNDFSEEVQFDEHGGVITDKEKIRSLRKEKRRKERELKKSKKRRKKSKKSKSKKKQSKSNKKQRKKAASNATGSADDNDDVEDGEITESSMSSSETSSIDSSGESENESDEKNGGVPIFKAVGRFQDIAKKYPPSLRIIVQETNTEGLKVGSLSLITFKGGTLGREGKHDVIIPDLNVSKCHLEFSYDRKKSVYKCIDLGSQNGTILNGERMSAPKVTSEPYNLVHGSVIQIGQTKLLCHTHEGNSTCGLCEPGLLIEAQTEKDATGGGQTQHLTHKEQLKRLQKKYGLENEKFIENKQASVDSNYNDRAATRRTKVGSSTDKEKTQSASVSTAITSENKGFKLLSKLGWTEGEALGKSQAESGLLEPINVQLHDGKRGLGSDAVRVPELSDGDIKKIATSLKMQERYRKSKDIFNSSEEN